MKIRDRCSEVAAVGRWALHVVWVRVCCLTQAFVFFCVISLVSPSIKPQSQTKYITSNRPALLPCNYSGFPTPSVYWTVTHSNTQINITQREPVTLKTRIGDELTTQVLTVFENGTLHISEVDYPDSQGHYECTAVNRLGIAEGNIDLTVVGGMASFNFAYIVYMQDKIKKFNKHSLRMFVAKILVRGYLSAGIISTEKRIVFLTRSRTSRETVSFKN